MKKIKILFVAMPSVHFIRWIENLDTSSYELYWFDILNRPDINTNFPLIKISNWNKKYAFKGYTFLKRHFPYLHKKAANYLYHSVEKSFEKWLLKINPDIVHSFEMQSCSYPILPVLQKHKDAKWLYSCWGSDIFYYQNSNDHLSKIKQVLKRINYLHTDCERDYMLAKTHGFKGEFKGVIPGGAGYNLNQYNDLKLPISERKIILVKGYQNHFGRALFVAKALQNLQLNNQFEIIIFGADSEVEEYCNKHNLSWEVHKKGKLSHMQIMELMGKAYLYIGNNISDGMPNTLLEAIVMGAIPIQSNPGSATAEIIKHGENGFLIENPENINQIEMVIKEALSEKFNFEKALEMNNKIANERLEYKTIQKKINQLYSIN